MREWKKIKHKLIFIYTRGILTAAKGCSFERCFKFVKGACKMSPSGDSPKEVKNNMA